MKATERFTSRWGLILSVIGIAVGTGNIWRFPRIVAANGGGSFLIPWVIFLFLWSIPLIMTEFALGKLTRYGTIGSFAIVVGKKFAWRCSARRNCSAKPNPNRNENSRQDLVSKKKRITDCAATSCGSVQMMDVAPKLNMLTSITPKSAKPRTMST